MESVYCVIISVEIYYLTLLLRVDNNNLNYCTRVPCCLQIVICDSPKLVINDIISVCILFTLYHTMISETVVTVG